MNYYPHHLGDYAKDTGHLSLLEHGAYRLLLDRYYSTEKPLPRDESLYRTCRARSKPEREAVDAVLREFFEERDDAYFQSRAEREIAVLDNARKRSAENGKKGGRKPGGYAERNPAGTQQVISGSVSETQSEATRGRPHSPNSQEPNEREREPQARDAPCSEADAWHYAKNQAVSPKWTLEAVQRWMAEREANLWRRGGMNQVPVTADTWRADLRASHGWATSAVAPRMNGGGPGKVLQGRFGEPTPEQRTAETRKLQADLAKQQQKATARDAELKAGEKVTADDLAELRRQLRTEQAPDALILSEATI